jgi:hypothetical protein
MSSIEYSFSLEDWRPRQGETAPAPGELDLSLRTGAGAALMRSCGTFSSYRIKLSSPPYSSGTDGPRLLLTSTFCWPDRERSIVQWVSPDVHAFLAFVARVKGRRFAKALKVLLPVDACGRSAGVLLAWRLLLGGGFAGEGCGASVTPLVAPSAPWTSRAPPGVSQPQIIPRQ